MSDLQLCVKVHAVTSCPAFPFVGPVCPGYMTMCPPPSAAPGPGGQGTLLHFEGSQSANPHHQKTTDGTSLLTLEGL